MWTIFYVRANCGGGSTTTLSSSSSSSSLLIRHARAQPANANANSAATAPPPPNPYGFNGNFSPPSLAIIIVIVVSAFFVVGFLTIYIHQCAGGSHLPTTTRRRALGLNPEIIDTFPTFLYSYVKDLKIGKGALECAVCLSEFEEQETLRWLPKCDHVFHPDCIDAWLSSHSTCPVCRSDLSDLSVAAPTPTTLIPITTIPTPISTNEDREIQFQNQSLNLIEINTLAYETVEAPNNSSGIPVEKKRVVRGRFPRSHSTGHLALTVRPGEDCERFTLRLPEVVRRQLVESTAAAKMKRAKSCVERGDGSVSSRRWRRVGGGGEGSSRGRWSDRWVFARAPSFFPEEDPLSRLR
ncbi:hypothetical protein Syun_004792 [Stephania yunnanensis]|uniref:RING-type E3 ubiquitin transferase n=1 Tax=Stephania yunnanensis TaxID=152371 RepID=A0AAP0L698_9MAGN